MTRFLQLLTIGAAAYTVWAVTAPLLAWPHTTATVIADEQPILLVDELLMQTDWIGPAQTLDRHLHPRVVSRRTCRTALGEVARPRI